MTKRREFNALGVICKKKMIELGMTQKELAQKIGTTDKYLDLIFHGERSGNKYIYKIAKVLHLNIEKLEKDTLFRVVKRSCWCK